MFGVGKTLLSYVATRWQQRETGHKCGLRGKEKLACLAGAHPERLGYADTRVGCRRRQALYFSMVMFASWSLSLQTNPL